jgi:hypothetical protein
MTIKSTLKKLLKGVLHTEDKGKSNHENTGKKLGASGLCL